MKSWVTEYDLDDALRGGIFAEDRINLLPDGLKHASLDIIARKFLMIRRVTGEVTRLLQRWRQGDQEAADRLAPVIYPELRRLAASHLRREQQNGGAFQPTELVHEAYLRLLGQNHPLWESRNHFFSVAARLMRQVLVDHARMQQAAKRGSGSLRVTLDKANVFSQNQALDLLRLDEAILTLESVDPRKARVLEQHYFGGLTTEEIAAIHGLSPITIRRDLRMASAWLRSFMQQ